MNSLEKFPQEEWLKNFTELKILDLSKNKISDFPKCEYFKYMQLEELDLSAN